MRYHRHHWPTAEEREARAQAAIHVAFACVDCSVNTSDIHEYYMVHDELWLGAGMTFDGGMLCIGCLEDRLGRDLTHKDFTDAPVNHGVFRQSERLLNRLGSTTIWYSPEIGVFTIGEDGQSTLIHQGGQQ